MSPQNLRGRKASGPSKAQKKDQNRHQRMVDIMIGVCAGQKLTVAGVEASVPTYGQEFAAPSDEVRSTVQAAIDECYTQITGGKVKSETSADVTE